MEIYEGSVLHGGIAVGVIRFLGDPARPGRGQADRDSVADKDPSCADPHAEEIRFMDAKEKARGELARLAGQTAERIGEEDAGIFRAQQTLLEDEELNNAILSQIRSQKVRAEYAVSCCARRYRAVLDRMKDEYFRARSADLSDVERRLIRILTGASDSPSVSGPCILTAEDLLPSDILQAGRGNLLAFVTAEGSPLSHTAILARGLNIPALCSVPVRPSWNGHTAAVDGTNGRLILDPDEAAIARIEGMRRSRMEEKRQYLSLKGKPSVTSDGKPIRLYANVGSLPDIQDALDHDAEGIGLFRTEFLYIGRTDLPEEEEQYSTYRKAAQMLGGRPLVIRTIDLGAEKQSQVLNLRQERNPALGFRGIRLCLARPELFRTQLRAIFRASVYGKLAVMFPMITSVEEVRETKKLIRSVQDELTDEQIPWKAIPVGIMIETPASVVLSDLLAQEVDFFSIGTNDLTQYTLAMDRQNGSLAPFYNPRSEAVLREIAFTVKNGHRHGCLVSVCGELGADVSVTDRLLKMGVDGLSVSPHMILPMRNAVRASCTDPDPEPDPRISVSP